jgi:WhiB family redox-sensing transcriptional regulator
MRLRSALGFSPGAAGPVLGMDDDRDWILLAECQYTDPEAFFPDKGGSVREAKRVCRSCVVRAECLEYALENDERFGVWGGLSERERNGPPPRISGRPPAHRPGFCGNDLHLMDDANTLPGNRCRACKRAGEHRRRDARAGKDLAA